MADENDQTQLPGGTLTHSLSAVDLQRYLAPDVATLLVRDDCSPRVVREAFAQLASAYYTISTYLPHHLIAHQLASSASGPWLEWVEGSLLFADVSGSTALAERLSVLGREGAEIVTSTLNAFFDAMLQIIEAAGGDLLTFGGDALLVLFRGPHHPHITTQAALDLLHICRVNADGTPSFQRTVPGIGTFALSMHIGVASGRVALVSAGQSDALRYAAMGSTVNSVAQAEAYGNRGDLVVGPATWNAIAPDATGEPVDAGYVRVLALHTSDLPPAVLPYEAPIMAAPEQAIPHLVQQLDRLTPYLPVGLLSRILIDPQRPRIEADLRPVTVLFAQVVGVGALVEELDPAAAAQLIDRLLRPMQAAIERFGGVINKLDLAQEGDKLLAIFGAPIAFEDHAERAARAALMMLDAFTALPSADLPARTFACPGIAVTLKLRIGLNTGSVFAGNVGSTTRKEYTVMGDAVNVAARVMTSTAWGEIWCSATTAAQIAPHLLCEERTPIHVKGKRLPLQLLRVCGVREQLPVVDSPALPLIGRQAQLDWLNDHLVAATTGNGRVVRISGEAGIGKSRLTLALLERAREHTLRSIQVNCRSYATNIPYAPWSEWLIALCAIESSDSPATRTEKLLARLATAGNDGTNWLPLLADLVHLEVAETTLTRGLDPQQRQTRRFELLADLLRATAHTTPLADDMPSAGLLIILEDMHHADQVSLDLWRYLARRIADVPVLLLGVHRPHLNWQTDDATDIGQHHADNAHVLTLHALSEPDSDALLTARMGAESLPTALRQQIVQRAAGNPLFLEELLLAVSNAAPHTAPEDSVLSPAPASHLVLDELPDSLHGLLLARIDQLDTRSRSLLLVASVIGQRFPFDILQAIHPDEQQLLIQQLRVLDTQEFTLLERDLPEQVYLFRHTLVQEVAYQSLLYARRRELHRRIGEYLEKRHAADLPSYYGLLAHHFRLSDCQDKAVTYLLLAGHAARDVYANDEAIQYYQWALTALGEERHNRRGWEGHKALGDVLCTIGCYDEALAAYAQILEAEVAPQEQAAALPTTDSLPIDNHARPAVSRLLPADVAAEALRSRGNALEKQGQYGPALDELRAAEALARAHLDTTPPLLLAAIYADMGLVLMRQGDYEQALAICSTGLSKLQRDHLTREDERIEASLHTRLGTIYGMRGDYAQARFHFENALAAQEAIDDLYGSSRSHNNIGYLWQLQSEYAHAIRHYVQAETLAQKISAKYILSSIQLNLAYAYYCQDQYDQAAAACDAALSLCQEMRDQDGIAKVYDVLGQIAYNRGQYDQALTCYAQSLALHRTLGSSYQEGNTLANTAEVYNALHQPAQAYALAEAACQIAERILAPQLRVEALLVLAEADLLVARQVAGANPAEAEALLARSAERAQQAAELALELGSKRDQGVARRILGRVAARRGQPYADHFEASLTLLTEIRNRFELACSQMAYAEALHMGTFPATTAYLKQARDTFREIGAQAELAHLDHLSERSV